MSQPLDVAAADGLPPKDAAAKPAGWTLVDDAPASDWPAPRDRAGAQRGMALLIAGGGLFWGAVAAAIWFATHRN